MAEMTGRRGRVVRKGASLAPQYELRDTGSANDLESLNVKEVSDTSNTSQ